MEEERAGAPSRFEQRERAVRDLPPGSTGRVRPAAVANLLGAA
jgi:phosphoribosylaminoimidazole carboxylase (NCAIR synthetase)